MQVKIIGGHGGVTNEHSATSYLIDDRLLIDAGSVASGLDLKAQSQIDHILISHAHLDHTKDLAFLSDNCFGMRKTPFQVYCHEKVLKAIKDHLFNDIIWPDFSKLPSEENPTMNFNLIEQEKVYRLGDYEVTPVHVEHPVEKSGEAFGFLITKNNKSLIFTQDTKATDKIWQEAHKLKNLKGIFTEVSFPNKLQKIADASDHHTPQSIKQEVLKMPKDVPIYLGHLKPNFKEELIHEINALDESRIVILSEDNTTFNF